MAQQQATRPRASSGAPPRPPALSGLVERVPTRTDFAVIGDRAVWRGGRGLLNECPTTVEAFGQLAETSGVRQFWVHETALPALGWPSALPRHTPRAGMAHGFTGARGPFVSSREGLCAWSYYYRRGGAGFDLHVPAYAAKDNPWRGTRSAVDLLEAVVAFDRATRGVRWCGTAAITSDVFLRAALGARLTSTSVPPPVETHAAQELALVWHRDPGPSGRNYKFLHALDLNMAYASAASSLELGTGGVAFVDWPKVEGRPRPGVYLFDPGRWPFTAQPAPYVRRDGGDGPLWVTAPTAERLGQLGYEPLEAYVYERQGRFLRPWYEMLRDARAALLEGPRPALEAVKQICRWGLGRMAADGGESDSYGRTLPRGAEYLEDDPTFQPVWAWSVIAETRCRLQRRISDLDALPVAVDTDAVYFLSSRRTPDDLARAAGLPLGDGLGQFKAHGSAKASDVLALLEGRDSAQVVGQLRGLVGSESKG